MLTIEGDCLQEEKKTHQKSKPESPCDLHDKLIEPAKVGGIIRLESEKYSSTPWTG